MSLTYGRISVTRLYADTRQRGEPRKFLSLNMCDRASGVGRPKELRLQIPPEAEEWSRCLRSSSNLRWARAIKIRGLQKVGPARKRDTGRGMRRRSTREVTTKSVRAGVHGMLPEPRACDPGNCSLGVMDKGQ